MGTGKCIPGQGNNMEQIPRDWMSGERDVVGFGGRERGMAGNEPETLS